MCEWDFYKFKIICNNKKLIEKTHFSEDDLC